MSFESIVTFIRSHQQPTLAGPPLLDHPAVSLLASYASEGFPEKVGPRWPMASIKAGIKKGPHTSATSATATAFCRQELLERSQRGFSIIFLVRQALWFFGRRLRISRLAYLDQANRKPRLICKHIHQSLCYAVRIIPTTATPMDMGS